ncbi:MAG: P1 family peptidase [bacterium]|nr:MAG: P1 family peptidase [bacterium]
MLLHPCVFARVYGGEENASRPRLRDIGVTIGFLPVGKFNAITDVPGVRVGHTTINRGDEIRTGVTAIVPHGGNVFREKVPAAVFVGNGFGKLAGLSQVQELGTIETPIILTSTLNVPEAMAALMEYTLGLPGNEAVRSVNPVVGETNDGYLNNIRLRPVTKEDILDAVQTAREGPVPEGSVGAGRGTQCLGFKGGIGTASRKVETGGGEYTVGVLVQSNFGGTLTVNGAPVGKVLGRRPSLHTDRKGSCMIVLATDAPVDSRPLERMARRAIYAMARTGAIYSNGSGDYAIAFSTHPLLRVSGDGRRIRAVKDLAGSELTPLFLAVQEATEEAILNSIVRAETVCGWKGHCSEAISIERLVEICRNHRATDTQ